MQEGDGRVPAGGGSSLLSFGAVRLTLAQRRCARIGGARGVAGRNGLGTVRVQDQFERLSVPPGASVPAGSERRARARVKKKCTAASARLASSTMMTGRSQVMVMVVVARGAGWAV